VSDVVSDRPPGCLACAAPLAALARFCSRCGVPVNPADLPHEPVAAVVPPPPQVPLERWKELKRALQLWVLLLACTGGLGVVMRISGSDSPSYELAGSIAFAIVTLAYALAMPRHIGSLLAPGRLRLSGLAAACMVWLGCLAFIQLYVMALVPLGVEMISSLESTTSHGWPLWSAFVLMAACPAVFEEIAFRGVIYERLRRVGGPREALIVQALMFSILHLLPAIFISHFVIGLGLGWLRARTGSLIPGMLAHGLYNATLLLLELRA
jgi:uncharacterized protein